jgi:hypothetical protein
MQRLTRIARLPRKDLSIFAEALFHVTVIRVALWVLPYSYWRKLFLNKATCSSYQESKLEMASMEPGEWKKIKRVVWAVEAAARRVPSATCLTQALAAKAMLNRRGFSIDLHIGVAKGSQGNLEAHAWIEYAKRVVIGGPEIKRYNRLLVLEEIV